MAFDDIYGKYKKATTVYPPLTCEECLTHFTVEDRWPLSYQRQGLKKWMSIKLCSVCSESRRAPKRPNLRDYRINEAIDEYFQEIEQGYE